jgi:hypothetical protein
MGDIGPDPALRPLNPFLDLLQELINQLRTCCQLRDRPAQITGQRVTAHRLGIRIAQRRG